MAATLAHPLLIQGGMGIGISDWRLARAVASLGQLGVVSGTAIDSVLVRRLQDGDVGGHVRRAMARFPVPEIAAAALERYFLPEGRGEGTPYAMLPMYRQTVGRARQQLTVLANFVEVHLAKEGHEGPVGINLLTKVQMPNLASLYGAMLAGVDYVLMGAGIPREIPGVLDGLAAHEAVSIRFDVEDAGRDADHRLTFAPLDCVGADVGPLKRPRFLPIISTDSLATMLARKANGRVDGFVIEGPTAGGHNAPPRGAPRLNERGEPIYGDRDAADLQRVRDLGLPFWLAGGTGSPERLRQALASGAAGIQVGTLFAFCAESGMEPDHRREVLRGVGAGDVDIRTDPRASPTGFPFKVVELEGSLSSDELYAARERVCDLGYLRVPYQAASGRIDYRCPAEPVDTYVKKGGDADETSGRKCLCNALMADIGLGQVRDRGEVERPLLTSGDELRVLGDFLGGRADYSAADVVDWLTSGVVAGAAAAAAAEVAPA
jgi:nitronate monooxygenase